VESGANKLMSERSGAMENAGSINCWPSNLGLPLSMELRQVQDNQSRAATDDDDADINSMNSMTSC
jgi:hypothetical protein